ncbi:MAG: hypothetical protein HOP19_08670 [Acidobacteria bacterium]|nr:hypothetical protein [Acidobacteriota bacterium]
MKFLAIPLLALYSCVVFAQSVNQSVGDAEPQNQNKPAAPKPTPTPANTSGRRPPSELQKALDEFRVQMGAPNAKGTAGRLKSAGRQNSLTGRVYENLRNDLFDAIPHQVRQRGGTTKSLLRRNQFGLTVSGPVRMPWLYDGRGKTYFSFSYEGTRERIAQSYLFTVPTDRQRLGDFSDLVDSAGQPLTLYDPATTRLNPNYDPTKAIALDNLQYLRDAFAGNVIPDHRLDATARALTALYPRANIAIGPFLQNNYTINSPFANRANGVITRLDHRLDEKQQLSFSMNASRGRRLSPEFFSGPGNSGAPSYDYESGQMTVQNTFTASPKVVWNFRLGTSFNSQTSLPQGDAAIDYPKQFNLSGVFSKALPRFFFSGSYLSLGPRQPVFRDRSYNYNATVGVSVNRDAHTLRFNGQARRYFANVFSPATPAGALTFSTTLTGLPGLRNTGNGFATFLLGQVTRAEETIVLHPSYWRNTFIDLNASDEYRVRPGVTLNVGVSFEISTPRIEKYDRQSTVSLDHVNPANGQPGALIFAGKDGLGRGLQPTTTKFEPEISLSLNPFNDRRTVMRVGYSLNYNSYIVTGSARHFGTQGFNAAPVFISPNEQLQPVFTLRSGLPLNFRLPPDLDATAANGTEPDFINRNGVLPIDQQWTFSLQRELPLTMQLEARYTGLRGTQQYVDSLIRVNPYRVSLLPYGERLYDDAFRNSLRPYPQYRSFELGGLYPAGDYAGHALTMTLDKRLSQGVFGRVVYRFSKLMDNYSSGFPQDPDNLREEWSLSTGDITHSLSVNYTYELPFGKARRFLNDGSPLAHVFGSWSLSGITSVVGGNPLSIRPLFNRTATLIGGLRANAVPGVDPHVENPTAEQWFNPAAFAQPDDFTLGNAGRTHPTLRGPLEQFHHLSLTKRVEITSDTSLEFVTESFNFPNHANLNEPDTRIGPASSPNANAGRIIGSTGGRVMQLGLRILF